MERCGTVIRTDGKNATVNVKLANTCSSDCEFYGVCKKHEEEIIAENRIDAKVGDRVRIEYPDGPFLLFAFITFILPLILMLLSAYLLWLPFSNMLISIIGGVIGLSVSTVIMVAVDRKIKKKEKKAVIIDFE